MGSTDAHDALGIDPRVCRERSEPLAIVWHARSPACVIDIPSADSACESLANLSVSYQNVWDPYGV